MPHSYLDHAIGTVRAICLIGIVNITSPEKCDHPTALPFDFRQLCCKHLSELDVERSFESISSSQRSIHSLYFRAKILGLRAYPGYRQFPVPTAISQSQVRAHVSASLPERFSSLEVS